MPSTGRFIVVDGGEGAGKSSFLSFCRQELSASEYEFVREPGGVRAAEKIRELLFHPETGAGVLTEFLLFWTARAEVIEKVIGPALAMGKNVICDRFDSSTFAYQVRGRQRPDLVSVFEQMREISCGAVKPYLYLFFDLDPRVGLARAKGRGDGNFFDEEQLEFHERVRRGYHEFFEGRRHQVIDASRSEREVFETALSAVRSACIS